MKKSMARLHNRNEDKKEICSFILENDKKVTLFQGQTSNFVYMQRPLEDSQDAFKHQVSINELTKFLTQKYSFSKMVIEAEGQTEENIISFNGGKPISHIKIKETLFKEHDEFFELSFDVPDHNNFEKYGLNINVTDIGQCRFENLGEMTAFGSYDEIYFTDSLLTVLSNDPVNQNKFKILCPKEHVELFKILIKAYVAEHIITLSDELMEKAFKMQNMYKFI